MMRALADAGVTEVRDFRDPTAMHLLPLPWRLLTKVSLSRLSAPSARRNHRYFKDGRFDLIALRTRVFDDAWARAHASGTRQLILLGAGLDGRAFRLPDLQDVSVFEVDHPDTQALKRERAKGLHVVAQRHCYVPLDFEHDSLEGALFAQGLRSREPSFWIWEGVTPYLTRPAQEKTLEAVVKCMAKGSGVALTYVEPEASKGELAGVRRLVSLLGEPFVGLLTRKQIAELLTSVGLSTLEDTGLEEWRARYTDDGGQRPSGFTERIAVAQRT
jgi:methyltransferase (TIGR00027 family)